MIVSVNSKAEPCSFPRAAALSLLALPDSVESQQHQDDTADTREGQAHC